jgi:excisionase family DNA binding protein
MSHQQLIDMLSVRQVADLLGLQESTVRAWVLRRRIPYLKIGRTVRIERAALEALFEASRVPAR